MRPAGKLSHAEFLRPDFKPTNGQIQALVEMKSPSEDSTIAHIQAGECMFSLRAPKRLIPSDAISTNWDFQRPDFDDGLMHGAKATFILVRSFCVLMSRLLDEFPKNIQSLGCHAERDQALMGLVEDAYTFKITFTNETSVERDCLASQDLAFGARMMYQLQDSIQWHELRKHAAHHVVPDQVYDLLARLHKTSVDKMCVIVCVDDIHALQTLGPDKYRGAMGMMNTLVHDPKCLGIAIDSSTTLRSACKRLSNQTQIDLPTTCLSRPQIHDKDIFQAFGNEALVQLLIDDMGGIGRASEVLCTDARDERTGIL